MKDVFSVPELLEAILINLPIEELLIVAQRVCKTWNTSIKKSPRLQQALFFSPLPGNALQYIHGAWVESDTDPHAYTVHMNPFYDSLSSKFSWQDTTKKERDALLSKSASWRRMLLSQPRVDFAAGRLLSPGPLIPIFQEHYNLTGLKFEDVMDPSGSDSEAFPLIRVGGAVKWMPVRIASDVRKIVRPKAWWLR